MLYIEHFVHVNKIRNAHPFEKFAFSILTMYICLGTRKEVICLIAFVLMTGILILRAGIPTHVIAKLFAIPLSFLLIGVFTIALTISYSSAGMVLGTEIAGYFLGFSQDSILLAKKTFVISLSAVSCLYFLALTTPMTDIIYVMQMLKFPPVVIEQMMLMYRFIFIFLDTAVNIYTAQSSRWGYSGYRKSLHSLAVLLANLWGKTYFRGRSLFISLSSRGYLEGLRVLNPSYSWSLKNIGFIIVTETVLIIAALS